MPIELWLAGIVTAAASYLVLLDTNHLARRASGAVVAWLFFWAGLVRWLPAPLRWRLQHWSECAQDWGGSGPWDWSATCDWCEAELDARDLIPVSGGDDVCVFCLTYLKATTERTGRPPCTCSRSASPPTASPSSHQTTSH